MNFLVIWGFSSEISLCPPSNNICKLVLFENHSNIKTSEIKPEACILIHSSTIVISVLLRKQNKTKKPGKEFAQLIISFSHHFSNLENEIAKIFRGWWIIWILTSFTHSIHVIRRTSDIPITPDNQLTGAHSEAVSFSTFLSRIFKSNLINPDCGWGQEE